MGLVIIPAMTRITLRKFFFTFVFRLLPNIRLKNYHRIIIMDYPVLKKQNCNNLIKTVFRNDVT